LRIAVESWTAGTSDTAKWETSGIQPFGSWKPGLGTLPRVCKKSRPWLRGLRRPLYESHAVSHCHMTGITLFTLSTDIIPLESTEMSWSPAPPAPVLEQPRDPMNVCP